MIDSKKYQIKLKLFNEPHPQWLPGKIAIFADTVLSKKLTLSDLLGVNSLPLEIEEKENLERLIVAKFLFPLIEFLTVGEEFFLYGDPRAGWKKKPELPFHEFEKYKSKWKEANEKTDLLRLDGIIVGPITRAGLDRKRREEFDKHFEIEYDKELTTNEMSLIQQAV